MKTDDSGETRTWTSAVSCPVWRVCFEMSWREFSLVPVPVPVQVQVQVPVQVQVSDQK